MVEVVEEEAHHTQRENGTPEKVRLEANTPERESITTRDEAALAAEAIVGRGGGGDGFKVACAYRSFKKRFYVSAALQVTVHRMSPLVSTPRT